MEVILNTLRPDGNLKDVIDNEVSLLKGTDEECEPLKWVVDLTVAYPDPQRPIDLLLPFVHLTVLLVQCICIIAAIPSTKCPWTVQSP
ncbi:hypothetical protein CEXT_100191 [Caerostris extrusa]|uniref:Uncharacterized protein n=1 Tax=Caerostris extrusa TaxID=172846 RepID=A0AAV4N6R1_CAEEX|nr:hypothetical protein CEXT_100191 [Caerostris extrusa]